MTIFNRSISIRSISSDQIPTRKNKSRNLRGHALAEYKKTIKLNPMQKEVLVGTLLGDASIPLRKGKSVFHVKFEQNIARAAYIQHLYSIFYNFVGTPPQVRDIRGGGAQDRQSMWFRTYGHPEFKFYDELFYPAHEHTGLRRKKRVPQNIQEFLTPRALAYWFMDDGTSSQRSYNFSTHSFPLEDQEILVQAFRDNFLINATIQKDRSMYRLGLPRASSQKFVDLISPYIHPCFDYKIK